MRIILLSLFLLSCGKNEDSYELNSGLYGKLWVNNQTVSGHGYVYTVRFNGNTADYRISGDANAQIAYTLVPKSGNTVEASANGTTSTWTYSLEDGPWLNMCIGSQCYRFGGFNE